MSNMESAQYYYSLGWSVFPLKPETKEPYSKLLPKKNDYPDLFPDLSDEEADKPTWKPYQFARATEAQVRQWWTEHPDAGIGLVLGKVSGIIVLDLDGEGADRLLRVNDLGHPGTAVSQTGGGGRHIFFRCNDDLPSIPRLIEGKDCHVEFRAAGNYVVLPPTVHPFGQRYEWISPPEEICELPDNIRKAAQQHRSKREGTATPIPEKIAAGQRNSLLTSLGGTLRRRGLPQATIEQMLLTSNADLCKPPLPKTEVRAIAKSVSRYTPGQAASEVAKNAPQGKPPQFHWTDLGNARRLVKLHGRDLRFCYRWTKWLVWDGKRWKRDDGEGVMQRAKDTVREMYEEASRIRDDDKRKELVDYARKCESQFRLKAMVFLAQSEPGIPITPEELDTNSYLLNCENGTLDLKTGTLRQPHRREDYLTKMAPVEFDPQANCPQWQSFLNDIFKGNQNITAFMQRALGYSLSGDVSEDVLFFLYGGGRNGKTTLIRTYQTLQGDYAIQTLPNLLLAQRNEPHPTGIADLFRVRFAATTEVEEGRRFAESLLKQMTGHDKIRARWVHENSFEFSPTHKIFLTANNKPRVRGQDEAVWSRIKLIPFDVTFTEKGEQGPDIDRHLLEKLCEELPGILNWAVQGCLIWQESGLAVPDEVKAATEEYRREEDVVAAFLEENCVIGPDLRCRFSLLRQAYEKWCKANGENAITTTALGKALTKRGFDSIKPSGVATRVGIGLLSDLHLLEEASSGDSEESGARA